MANPFNDNGPLTTKMKDGMAKMLRNDWKLFARATGVLMDPLIENIDFEERAFYEKCQKMLNKWEQHATVAVTVSMVKSILMKLHRNDILLDVFNYSPAATRRDMPSSESQDNVPVANLSISVEVNAQPNVRDLKRGHIKKLKNYLDPDHGHTIGNWSQLGSVLFQHDKIARDSIKSLHLCYCGGGSPANAFLTNLGTQYPQYTVAEFIKLAKDHQRRDISNYLDSLNCPPEQQFRMLDVLQRKQIATLLDKHVRGASDWRDFADEIGFTNNDIDDFKLALKENHQYSPTESLFDYLKKSHPKLLLQQIKMAASDIQRNDVASYLGSVIIEINTSRDN